MLDAPASGRATSGAQSRENRLIGHRPSHECILSTPAVKILKDMVASKKQAKPSAHYDCRLSVHDQPAIDGILAARDVGRIVREKKQCHRRCFIGRSDSS